MDNEGIHVCLYFESFGGSISDLLYARSTDGGVTFFDYFDVAYGTTFPSGPAISVDPAGVNVVYTEIYDPISAKTEVRFRRRSYGPPPQWGDPVVLAGSPESYGSADVATALIGGNWVIFVIYERETTPYKSIWYRYSTNGGNTWEPEQVVYDDRNNSTSADPTICGNSRGEVYVAFVNNNNDAQNYGKFRVRTLRLRPNQESQYHTLTTIDIGSNIYQLGSKISIDDFPNPSDKDSVHIVWEEDRYYPGVCGQIFYNSEPIEPISTNDPLTGSASMSDIAVNYVTGFPYRHVIWTQRYSDIDPSLQMWYRKKAEEFPPDAPTNLQCTALCDWMFPAIFLWWNPSSASDLAGYNVYRSYQGGPYTKRNTCPVEIISYFDPTEPGDPCPPPYQWYCYQVKSIDYGENESVFSNACCVGYSTDSGPSWVVEAGLPQPSRYTVERSGYTVWGEGKGERVDFRNSRLIYKFSGLDKSASHVLALAYYESPKDTGRVQELEVDGTILQSGYRVPEKATPQYFLLSKNLTQDGEILLTLKKVKGKNVVVSGIALWEIRKGGGPQSSGASCCGKTENFLSQNFPNPMSRETEIRFGLSQSGIISLKIYNVTGRLVRTLIDRRLDAGVHILRWDGKDDFRRETGNGVYFYRLESKNFSSTRKITLLR